MFRAIYPAALTLLVSGCMNVIVVESDDADPVDTPPVEVAGSPLPDHQRNNAWYTDGKAKVRATYARHNITANAKNVVLFLGDGMGVSTVTAARILAGQRAGNPGEEHLLSFEEFPVTGLVKTYNVNAQVPDSAATMSAIVTGVKTTLGTFGIDERVVKGDCESGKGGELLSLLDVAELAGKATGVVTTARITHATPGATYAKTAHRYWEDDAGVPDNAKAEGCVDVAAQLLNYRERLNETYGEGATDGIEVAMGGGRGNFLPKTVEGGRRADQRNLIDQWQTANPGGIYLSDRSTFDTARRTPVLGLFSNNHIPYASERSAPDAREPSLTAMTLKALELLQQDNDGFLLVVEAGRIDHAHHAGNAANALNETIELSEAVAATLQSINLDNTLVMVTADHSHVFTIGGYPSTGVKRGNPILGKVVTVGDDGPTADAEGLPFTTLGYRNGRGYADHGDEPDADSTYGATPNAGRKDISNVDTTRMGYHQEVLVPLSSETHGGEDVAVYATGPGALGAMGTMEQSQLFHVMLNATTWEAEAAARLANLRDKR